MIFFYLELSKLLHRQLYIILIEFQPEIPITDNLDPLSLLTDDAQIATWNNEGLPNDRMSSENATILTNSERWPLIVDPQVCDHVIYFSKHNLNIFGTREVIFC